MKLLEETGRQRYNYIQKLMEEKGFDFLILTQAISFEYLVFTKIPYVCIVSTKDEPLMFTHKDSVNLVASETWSNNIIGIYPYNVGIGVKDRVEESFIDKTVEYITSYYNVNKKIGMDFSNTSFDTVNTFCKNLSGYKMENCNFLLSKIFSIRSKEECEIIKKAAEIAELGVRKSKEYLERNYNKNLTENQLASYAEYNMRKCNIDGFFVRSSVTSGERGILIGAVDSNKVINEDEIINVDFSPIYKRYYADICRILSAKVLDKEIKDRCKMVEEALDIAIDSIKPGVIARDIDRRVRKYFEEKGVDGEFIHHTGHPVGNSWGVIITSNSGAIIEEGMTFALEPGLYNSKVGGIRIEDNIYVGKKKNINFMQLPRILH